LNARLLLLKGQVFVKLCDLFLRLRGLFYLSRHFGTVLHFPTLLFEVLYVLLPVVGFLSLSDFRQFGHFFGDLGLLYLLSFGNRLEVGFLAELLG